MGCGASTTKPGMHQAKVASSSPPLPPPPPPPPVPVDDVGGDSDDDDIDQRARFSVAYQSRELPSARPSRASGVSTRARTSSAVFDTANIGTCTRHGIAPLGRYGVKAKINQDRGLVCWPFNGSTAQALFCVFDGHGRAGEKISELCMTSLPGLLDAEPTALTADPAAQLSKQVVQLDAMLDAPDLRQVARSSGTTATVVYLHGNSCWVACAGDSRAVLGSFASGASVSRDLSRDHKPDDPVEMERILRAGGEVSAAGPDGQPPPSRLWGASTSCGLAMARSIGDRSLRRYGCIPQPEVQEFSLQPAESAVADGDRFIIVASDGVWEFISSQQAVEIVASSDSDATKACERLVRAAQQRWQEEEGTYRDDITAIVAMLPFLDDIEVESDTANAADEEGSRIQLNAGMEGITTNDADAAAAALAAVEPGVADGAAPAATAGRDEGNGRATREGAATAAAAAGGAAAAAAAAGGTAAAEGSAFVARRLSVSVLRDADDDEEEEEEGEAVG